MFRTGATRSACQGLARSKPSSLRRLPSTASVPQSSATARFFGLKHNRPLGLTAYKPACSALVRFASTTHGGHGLESASTTKKSAPYDKPDFKHEKDVGERKLPAHPDRVSASSAMPMMGGTPPPEEDEVWGASIRSEFNVVLEVLSLKEVPRDALYLGLAGVLPYLATSISTFYLAYDLNHSKTHGFGVLLDAETAQFGLQIMEPLQIGYGAVIISFLGAIHWGFEWAGFRGHYPWDRYKVGVIAPAIAWPTLLLPIEHALIAQFLAFNYLYFNDANATTKGIVPAWYGIYRFMLTFVVGASIVLSLVGRGQVAEYTTPPGRPTDVITQYADRRAELMEQEEREKAERRAQAAEEDDEEEEGEEEEDEEEEE